MTTLLNQLINSLQHLSPVWGPYLKKTQGLDLYAKDLEAELSRPLNIDRSVPGFEDFSPQGTKGIEPGDPASSLLYHALASPNVCPDGANSQDFPNWAELDALENYIWGLQPLQAADLEGKVIAVFAYQYRPKPATTHQLYADLAYSRMGFARVGNAKPFYIGSERGYTADTGVSGEVAVLPARYGAFLAEWRTGANAQVSLIGEPVDGDNDRKFLYPLRKLFPGQACVDANLTVDFSEWHLSTKLARVVSGDGTPDGKPMALPPGIDAHRSPFIRQSPDPELVVLEKVGQASVSIMPPAAPLVRVAKQQNSVTNQLEIARFQVPPAVSPALTDVVTAILQNSALTELVDNTTVAMRYTGKLSELDAGIGAQLDASGATAKLTGDPKAKASELTIEQIKAIIAAAAALIQSGKATQEQIGQAIFMFQILLTIKLLNDEKTAPAVSEQDKANLFGFVVVEIQKTVLNRHYSSLSMVGDLEKVLSEGLQLILRQPARVGRNAPEFANIRHKVIDPAYPADPSEMSKHLLDLNTLPLPAKPGEADPFGQAIADGGYEVALFEDGVSDGCVSVAISGLPAPLIAYPAFSVIGAPSLFPRSSDLDLEAWWKTYGRDQFAEGDPQPLAEGRFAANPAIRRPGSMAAAFDFADKTYTAVLGRPCGVPGHAPPPNHLRKKFRTSFMPDAASNEFYPGWDVTIDTDKNGEFFYTTHGLGSPYPEDVKFCSAANGFWPAAAPDSARVFHRLDTPTSIPLMDSELGYHPDSPMVAAGKAKSAMGWDGGYGPFFQEKEGKLGVNYASMDRTDYVSNALAGTFGLDLFEKLKSDVLIERLDVQRLAIATLPPNDDTVRTTTLWLITAYEVEDWAKAGDPDLKGHGFFFQFVTTDDQKAPVQLTSELPTQTNKFTRLWQEVDKVYTCRVTLDAIRWWEGSEPNPTSGAILVPAGSN